MRLRFEIDSSKFKGKQHALKQRNQNMQPAFAQIASIMVSSIQNNFTEEGRYQSDDSWRGGELGWKDLAPSTIEQRQKRGTWPGKILTTSAQLVSSIHGEAHAHFAEAGTNLIYAAIHNFGGMAGRNKAVEIPARPYMVLQDEDIEEAIDIVEKYLTKGLES